MSKPSAEALQLVKSLMELPENSICADCQKKAAKWASSTLGVFICIDCSGIHRSLGTHISFVRSCTLDSWTPEQARLMRRVGNRIANEFWEARLPRDFIRPATGDRLGMESFIRAKYIEKRWAAPGVPPHLRTAQHNPTGGSVKPSINMYEGYFQHNPMAQQQQPSYSIMGSTPAMHQSRSNESMKKKKFAAGESGHRPFFAANGSPTPEHRTANHTNSMNLDEFMSKMNSSHQSNENLEIQPNADSQEHSSFDFLNQPVNSNSSTDVSTSNESIEINSANPFGPGGVIQESPLAQNSQPPPTIPTTLPNVTPAPIKQEKEKPLETESSEERPHIPHPKTGSTGASLSAQEIMQQQQSEPNHQKAYFTGKKKQSLFGKKSKASRFAKKPTPPSQDGHFVVDQMLNIAESSFRPVSAPVYQNPPKQMSFAPSAQQQYNYMMSQQQTNLYQQSSSDFNLSQPTNIYEQTQQNLYQQPPQNIYQQTQQNLYQQPPQNIYQQTQQNLYQQSPQPNLYQQNTQNIYQQPSNLYQQAQQNLSQPPQNIYEQAQHNLSQQPQNIYEQAQHNLSQQPQNIYEQTQQNLSQQPQQPNYYQQQPSGSQQLPSNNLW